MMIAREIAGRERQQYIDAKRRAGEISTESARYSSAKYCGKLRTIVRGRALRG